MNKSILLFTILLTILNSCSKDDNLMAETPQPGEKQGCNMLLIGNSFFRSYAEKFNIMAFEAGFENHNAAVVFRGGEIMEDLTAQIKTIKNIFMAS